MGTPIERESVYTEAVIANAASVSGAIDISRGVILAIELPAAWTAAALTFQGSLDGTNYANVYDDAGTEVSVASANVVAGRLLVNKTILEQLAGLRWLKIRSGTVALPVAQGAARTFKVVVKG